MECLPSEKRLSTFMVPDYKAWKESRERHQIRLRSATRLQIAERRVLERLCIVLKTRMNTQEIANETIWCLALLTSGQIDNTAIGLYYDVLPVVVSLIRPENVPNSVISMWLVSSLCGISMDIRTLAYQEGVISRIFEVLAAASVLEAKSVTWTLVLLLTDFDFTLYDFQEEWLRSMIGIVTRSRERDIWVDLLSAIALVTDSKAEFVSIAMDMELVDGIMAGMESDSDELRIAALKAIRSFIHFPDISLNRLLSKDVISCLIGELFHNSPAVIREALTVVSDLSAFRLVSEVTKMTHRNVFIRIIELLRHSSHSIQMSALWTLSSILSHAQWTDCWTEAEMERKGFNEILEGLITHPSAIVYQKAMKILEDFFEFHTESDPESDFPIIDSYEF